MKKIVIMEGNETFAKSLAEYFAEKGMEVSGMTDDGNTGLEYVRQFNPDVIVLGMVLKGLDGLAVLDKLKEAGGKSSVIAVGNFSDDAFVSRVLEKGACYYLMKPVSREVIGERVCDVLDRESVQPAPSFAVRERRGGVSLDEKISNIFISIGIPASIKGYAYLREGVKMAVADPLIINNITKELYPRIAEKFATTPSKVERAIRQVRKSRRTANLSRFWRTSCCWTPPRATAEQRKRNEIEKADEFRLQFIGFYIII